MSNGKSGIVDQVRHKYVARFHYVLETYEKRFPENVFLKAVKIDLVAPGGLDGLKAQLKDKRDWVFEESKQYVTSPMPLAVLAFKVGVSTIEAAQGLVSFGFKLKVAAGNNVEIAEAHKAISGNNAKGCILDLNAFWTAWRLGTLDIIRELCGPIGEGSIKAVFGALEPLS